MLVDTHAHLNFRDYEKDLERVIAKAGKAGVAKIICVSSNIADSEKAVAIAREYPGTVFAAVGIHPQKTDPENADTPENQIGLLEKLAGNKSVVAIGECGLDFSPAPPGETDRPRQEQESLFRGQIEIARKYSLPLIIHTRKAFAETMKILGQNITGLPNGGVVHCYSAGKKGIAAVLNVGLYFGLDGNLTYDPGLQSVAKLIPAEKLLLETDSPFLTPEPYRGSRNEPANVKITADKLAEIKNQSFTEISKITTNNAAALFGL